MTFSSSDTRHIASRTLTAATQTPRTTTELRCQTISSASSRQLRRSSSKRRPRSSTISQRPVIFQPFHDPTKRAPIVLEGLDQPAAETLTKQDTSGSFILVDTSGTANKPEDEEVDEEFTTPVLGEADETLPSSESSVRTCPVSIRHAGAE